MIRTRASELEPKNIKARYIYGFIGRRPLKAVRGGFMDCKSSPRSSLEILARVTVHMFKESARLTSSALVLLPFTMMLFDGDMRYHNHSNSLVKATDLSQDLSSLCAAIVDSTGYPCIEHTVQTADGYVLGLQNIPCGLHNSGEMVTNRPPVFLQHGLIEDGDDWVLNSPEEALAYLMADAGFDVWIGNTRNTRWTHGHVSLSKQSQDYWNWSWDELAAYDLPASLSYVYRMTNYTKLCYVGHSMGTLTVLAALSEGKSEVVESLEAVALLSPIAYVGNISSPLVQLGANLYIDKIFQEFGLTEFSLSNAVGLELLSLACVTPGIECGDLLSAVTGSNCCLNTSRIPYYLQFEPQSTSLKNMVHFAQMVRRGTFAKYDYGEEGNKVRYNQPSPPPYDASNIDSSIAMLIAYGGKDAIADSEDVTRRLLPLLSPGRLLEVLYLPNYAHSDFILGNTAYEDLYPHLISFFRTHHVSQLQ